MSNIPSAMPYAHSEVQYQRYTTVLQQAVNNGEHQFHPSEIPYCRRPITTQTCLTQIRAALLAKRRYDYKCGLTLDSFPASCFKVRALATGYIEITFQPDAANEPFTPKGRQRKYNFAFPEHKDEIAEMLKSFSPDMHHKVKLSYTGGDTGEDELRGFCSAFGKNILLTIDPENIETKLIVDWID